MELIRLTLLVTIILSGLILGLVVLRSNQKATSNRLFFGIAISIVLWNVFSYLGYTIDNSNIATIFFRYNFLAVIVALAFFHFFSIYFPKKTHKIYPILNYFILILATFLAVASPTTSLVISNTIINGNNLEVNLGPLGYVFYLYVFLICATTIYNLIIKYRRLEKTEKSKIAYFLVGLFIYTFLNILFNFVIYFLFPDKSQITQLGDFSAIVLLTFTAYAILRHQLFNIKIIATESAVVFISVALFTEIAVSGSNTERILVAIIWVAATYGGWLLINSVKHEIKQKEELEMLAGKLREANMHLKELDKLKDDFLSMASHELNTPLAAIEGYLSMILEEGMGGGDNLNPQTREYLDRIFKSSQRLANIVKDLLNVSRIESGRIHLIYAQAQIEDLIKQTNAEMDPNLKEKKHTICLELPEQPLAKSWMDTTRITEVLINLLGNAVKYTDKGGHIEMGAKEVGRRLRVWVKDNGRGIPKDKVDKVFQKFTQVDVLKDEVKGTGLGMYISQKFVELHKGKIWFESAGDGKGTTFIFELPIIEKKPYDPYEGEGAILR